MKTPLAHRRGAVFAVTGFALAVMGRLAGEAAWFRDWHRAVGLPLVARLQQPLSGAVSSTLGEPATIALALVALSAIVRWRSRVVGVIVGGVGALILLFYVTWGTAYRYPTLASRMAAPSATADASDLVNRAEQAAHLVARAAAALPSARDLEGEDVLVRANVALRDGFDALPPALEAAPVRRVHFGPAKISRVSWALSRLQLSGYYFPWTGEAQINGEMPRSLWPRVAAHEKAHQRGFARENEATVIGLLACLASSDPFSRYSASLGVFAIFDRDLARVDGEARRALWDRLPARAVDDFRREIAFWKRFDGPAAVVSEKVNDTYLKSQGVRSGVASYGETTLLLLQAIETPGLPLRAALEEEIGR